VNVADYVYPVRPFGFIVNLADNVTIKPKGLTG
jgi:hypothetical protein